MSVSLADYGSQGKHLRVLVPPTLCAFATLHGGIMSVALAKCF
jgi:hypothetical protein